MGRHKMEIVAAPRGDGAYVVVDGPKPTIGRTLRVEETRGVFSEVAPSGGLQEETLFEVEVKTPMGSDDYGEPYSDGRARLRRLY